MSHHSAAPSDHAGPAAPFRILSPALLIKLGLTSLLLALALLQLKLDHLPGLLSRADASLLGAAVLYAVAYHALRPLRWRRLLRSALPDVSYGVALRSSLFGTATRLLLPSRIGELARVLVVDRLPLLAGIGLAVLALLMDAATAFALAVPAALVFLGPVGATTALLLTALSSLALLRPQRVLGPVSRLRGLRRLRDQLTAVETAMRGVGRPTLLQGLGIGLLLHALRFAQLYVLLAALGPVPSYGVVIVFPLIQLADGLPLTIGGVGPREWIGLAVLPLFGVPPESAVAAVFLQFVLGTLLPGVAGGWILVRRGDRLSARFQTLVRLRAESSG